MVMPAHPTGLPFKPEQTFFADSAHDRLLAMVMTLAAKLHVTCDRLACLEMLLESGKPVTREALDLFQPTPEQAQQLDAARQALASEPVSYNPLTPPTNRAGVTPGLALTFKKTEKTKISSDSLQELTSEESSSTSLTYSIPINTTSSKSLD